LPQHSQRATQQEKSMNVTRRITLAALAAGAALTLWGCGKSNDNASGNAAPGQ